MLEILLRKSLRKMPNSMSRIPQAIGSMAAILIRKCADLECVVLLQYAFREVLNGYVAVLADNQEFRSQVCHENSQHVKG